MASNKSIEEPSLSTAMETERSECGAKNNESIPASQMKKVRFLFNVFIYITQRTQTSIGHRLPMEIFSCSSSLLFLNEQQENIFIVANYILNSTFPYLLHILLLFFLLLLFCCLKLQSLKNSNLLIYLAGGFYRLVFPCVLVYKSLFFQLMILFWKKDFRSTRHHAQFPLLSKLVFISYILWKTFYSIKSEYYCVCFDPVVKPQLSANNNNVVKLTKKKSEAQQ